MRADARCTPEVEKELRTLLASVREPEEVRAEYAANVLARQCAASEARREAVRQLGGIGVLVDLIRDEPAQRAAEHAALALANLCISNQANRDALYEVPSPECVAGGRGGCGNARSRMQRPSPQLQNLWRQNVLYEVAPAGRGSTCG